jgi:hypothetical protein
MQAADYIDAPSSASISLSESSATCERCCAPFTRRERSGGSPQRYCSARCRSAARSRDEVPSVQTSDKTAAKPAENCTLGTGEFDWFKDESVILEEQLPVAVYFNERDHLVIRQRDPWHGDEDTFIYIAPQNIDAFIDKLTDVVGIPSAGKRK